MAAKTRRRTRGALPLALALALSGCFSEEPEDTTGPNGGNGNGEDVVVVNMTPDLRFDPSHVEIRSGQTIRWVNVSNFPHTSTADPRLAVHTSNVQLPAGAETWDSGDIGPGASFERTFTVTGDYRYFCRPHEGPMVGTIRVIE